jgi:hypothetical protein
MAKWHASEPVLASGVICVLKYGCQLKTGEGDLPMAGEGKWPICGKNQNQGQTKASNERAMTTYACEASI